jgi:transcriptional regulator with XRE-family HTH domain
MEFLGYCPYEPSPTLGSQLIAIRQKFLGITQEKMARAIGIDPTTLSRIERTDARRSGTVLEKIERYCQMLRKT